jgi:pimeloyl-ACP methyl ester carboxylesterase
MKRLLRLTRRLLTWVGVALLCLVVTGFVYERIQRATSHRAYPPPGSLVEVDGHLMHLDCEGAGTPAVLLEAGQDVRGSLSWYPVKRELTALTRVCAYDRAGILWSEPGPGPRTSRVIARELAALLEEAGEEGPFVLVGHSMGGVHMRAFADLDRSRVAGLVFVDASHPDQDEHLPAEVMRSPPLLVRTVVKFLNGVGLFRFVDLGPDTSMPDSIDAILARFRPSSNIGSWAEFESSSESREFVRGGPGFGDLPLVVLTSTTKPSFVGQDLFDRTHAAWIALHEELADLSTEGVHRIVPGASHYIQEDRPDVVIEAISDVVSAVRRRGSSDDGRR